LCIPLPSRQQQSVRPRVGILGRDLTPGRAVTAVLRLPHSVRILQVSAFSRQTTGKSATVAARGVAAARLSISSRVLLHRHTREIAHVQRAGLTRTLSAELDSETGRQGEKPTGQRTFDVTCPSAEETPSRARRKSLRVNQSKEGVLQLFRGRRNTHNAFGRNQLGSCQRPRAINCGTRGADCPKKAALATASIPPGTHHNDTYKCIRRVGIQQR
jgi:hypothetical protein